MYIFILSNINHNTIVSFYSNPNSYNNLFVNKILLFPFSNFLFIVELFYLINSIFSFGVLNEYEVFD